MNWKALENENEIEKIITLSHENPILIFKHSTRCSISDTALNRLERNWQIETDKKITTYYLDLISYRNISNRISEIFEIDHESPQILIIKNGKCIYDASHLGISYTNIIENIN
jgi:bacillithiol system protein YtxJ